MLTDHVFRRILTWLIKAKTQNEAQQIFALRKTAVKIESAANLHANIAALTAGEAMTAAAEQTGGVSYCLGCTFLSPFQGLVFFLYLYRRLAPAATKVSSLRDCAKENFRFA